MILSEKTAEERTAFEQNYSFEREQLQGEKLQKYQFDLLKKQLDRVYMRSSFYRRRFEEACITPEDIQSFDDFWHKVPVLSKKDLMQDQEDNPPYGNRLCVPEEEIRRFHITSGSSGMGQEIHCLTANDILNSAITFIPHFMELGLKPGNISAHLWPVATMPGGLIALDSLRLYGINPVLLGIYDTKTKLKYMKKLNPHHLFTTPAYLTRLAAVCQEVGINPREDFSRLKGITLSTEAFPPGWIQEMEKIWGAPVHDIYGSTQMCSCYAFTCRTGSVTPEGGRGYYHLHHWYNYVEILNRETGEPVEPGEWGEPVITNLWNEATPLIRFRQDDRVKLLPGQDCQCGRPTLCWEVGSISRYDDMIKMKATNVWPQAVDEVIFSYVELDEYNGKVYIDDHGKEQISVVVEFKQEIKDQQLKATILQQVSSQLKEKTGVGMNLIEADYGTIERFEYKARRWTDERQQGLERVKYLDKK